MPDRPTPIAGTPLTAIKELVKEGCDRAWLDVLLQLLREAQTSSGTKTLCGVADGRELRKSIKLLRQAAECIRQWRASFACHELVRLAGTDAEMRICLEFPAPELLEGSAILMKLTYFDLASQRHLLPRLARAWLTNYVYACTKKPHDAEVAELVAIASGSEVITYIDQKQWRWDNRDLLRTERARFMRAIPHILRQPR